MLEECVDKKWMRTENNTHIEQHLKVQIEGDRIGGLILEITKNYKLVLPRETFLNTFLIPALPAMTYTESNCAKKTRLKRSGRNAKFS
jgi:hypothetical protein